MAGCPAAIKAFGTAAVAVLCSAAILAAPAPAAETAATANPAGGADTLWGSWHSQEDRQGVTAAWGDDGSLTVTTSYYSVELPPEWASLGASFCYDEDMFALSMRPSEPNDRSAWSWIACDLLVSVPGAGTDGKPGLVGVYLARAGEDAEVLLSATQGALGAAVGDAAAGDGWVVVAYALYRPGDQQDQQRASDMLETLAARTTPRGSSTQPPVEPEGFQAIVGG